MAGLRGPCDGAPMTNSPRTPRTRRCLSLAAVGLLALTAATACRPTAASQPKRRIRACDLSTCLIAWQVVDSDGDGISDADELMTGTDPHDPASRPGLAVVIQTLEARKLPSFEYGQSFLVIVPADVQAARERVREVPVDSAIPVGHERTNTLAGLGIDVEDLAAHGIDPNEDGFTIGLGPKKTGEALPPKRMGGIDVSLISADQDDDCCVPVDMSHGEVTEQINYGDWQSTTYADGAQTVCSDVAGCKTYPPGSPDYYTDPDADPTGVPAEPTEEQKKHFARMQGAITRRVENWNLPEVDPEKVEDPWVTVILVDPDYVGGPGPGAIVYDAPRVTSAQPEGRSDLPSPFVGAPGGPGGPDCTVGCG